jgi:eukaryotic-like serine/threonine-protein kinase
MAVRPLCPHCGEELPVDAPAGLCPRCLLQRGLQTGTAAPHGLPVDATLAPRTIDSNGMSPGSRVRYFGDYEILQEIARGGKGVVYKASQLSLNRVVALKMILSGQLASKADVQRFYTEAQAAANLQHPHIVPIYEVGEHQGQHYFSMEYIAAGSLADQLKGAPMPPLKAAALVETLARAIHAAHDRGIVHRDLKPANVLLTAEGLPKITDFGLAKKLDDTAGLTASHDIVGTPSYMAPEQTGGRSSEIGPATDLYALGAILYEMLTGQPPFRAATALDTILQVVSAEPVPPRQLQSKIPRDLETICLLCLRKEPSRRYASAAALAEDLARFQVGKPIEARPVGRWERAIKWARRRPAVAGLTGALAAVAAIGLALVTWQWRENVTARSTADQRREQADDASKDAERSRSEAGRQKHLALEQAAIAIRQEAAARRAAYTAHVNLAQRAWQENHLSRVLALLDQDRPKHGETDLRSFEWYYLWHLCHPQKLSLTPRQGAVRMIAYSPDGKLLASAGDDGMVKFSDSESGEERGALKASTHAVRALAYSPDGKTLATLSTTGDIKLWDVATKRHGLSSPDPRQLLCCLAFSPDVKTLATAGQKPEVILWDATKGVLRKTFEDGLHGWVYALAFSPDGKTLAVGGEFEGAAEVNLLDAVSGKKVVNLKRQPSTIEKGNRLPEFLLGIGAVTSLAFSPDGRQLATGHGFSNDNGNGETVVKLWDLASGNQQGTFRHEQAVTAVAFARDDKTLASACADGTVHLWDVQKGEAEGILHGNAGAVLSLAYSPDGTKLATSSAVGAVTLWDVGPEQERNTLLGGQYGVASVSLSPDNKLLATGGRDGTTIIWNLATRHVLAKLANPPGAMEAAAVAFSPDGRSLAIGTSDHQVRLFDVAAKQVRATLHGPAKEISCVAFSPDGKSLAAGSKDQTVFLWDMATRQQRAVLTGHPNAITCLVFSPNGQILAVGSGEPDYGFSKSATEIRLWDLPTRSVAKSLADQPGAVTSVAFSPDGKWLAAGYGNATGPSNPGEARLWDLSSGQVVHVLRSHRSMVWCVAFSPDGKTLATASHDQLVKLWDPVNGEERASLGGHSGPVRCLAFGRDNKLLVSASGAPVMLINLPGEVILWHAAGEDEVGDRKSMEHPRGSHAPRHDP